MTPQRKLHIANALIILGILPFSLSVYWTFSILAWARANPGQAGGSDAFLMIFLLGASWIFATVVAGGGALWSRRVARCNPDARTRLALVLRALAGLTILLPLLAYGVLILISYWPVKPT
ncbi:hypothetical protein ACHMW6_28465 [Pseudoduganella sp. UC29_106]|uniref:hypothetical protein n=1 Tax=Pseudoduganella sp. UC29_106 TaxID=3374553 RepID=UPI00375749AC